jgi:hypothetical protein
MHRETLFSLQKATFLCFSLFVAVVPYMEFPVNLLVSARIVLDRRLLHGGHRLSVLLVFGNIGLEYIRQLGKSWSLVFRVLHTISAKVK